MKPTYKIDISIGYEKLVGDKTHCQKQVIEWNYWPGSEDSQGKYMANLILVHRFCAHFRSGLRLAWPGAAASAGPVVYDCRNLTRFLNSNIASLRVKLLLLSEEMTKSLLV